MATSMQLSTSHLRQWPVVAAGGGPVDVVLAKGRTGVHIELDTQVVLSVHIAGVATRLWMDFSVAIETSVSFIVETSVSFIVETSVSFIVETSVSFIVETLICMIELPDPTKFCLITTQETASSHGHNMKDLYWLSSIN